MTRIDEIHLDELVDLDENCKANKSDKKQKVEKRKQVEIELNRNEIELKGERERGHVIK